MESKRQLREYEAATVWSEKEARHRHLEEIRVQLYRVTVFSHCVDTIHSHITHPTFNEGIAATAAEMPCEIPALTTGRPFLSPIRFCTWLQGTPACSKNAGPHRDQGRRMGLEGSLGLPSSGQTPCLLRAEGMAALLCLLPVGGHSYSGCEHKREVQNRSTVTPNLARHPNLSFSPACNRHCTEGLQLATKTSQPPTRYTVSSPPTPYSSTSSLPAFRKDSLFIFPTCSGRREPLQDFFGGGEVLFCLYVFQSQWAEGKASPCKCAASLLWAPISPSGTLPGDTDEILGLPLDCTKCPWNCQVRRKGAVQEVTDSKTLKDQPKSMTLTVPIPVPMKQETHLTPFNNQRWSAQILKVYQLFLHKHWQNHPQLISSKHFWDSCHMKTFGSFLLVLDDCFFPLLIWWRGLSYLLNGITAFPLKSLF